MKNLVNKAIKLAKEEGAKPKGSSQQTGKKKIGHNDQELIDMLEASKAKIRVVGCGGGGCNTINRMTEVGILGAETVAINTDAQDLLKVKADMKLLIGKKLTRGLGAGSDPSVGEASAQESFEELAEMIGDSDLVFITCGMGG